MQIHISTTDKEWTDFETKEWAIADQEHYGQSIDWEKLEFRIFATDGDETIGNLRIEVQVGVANVVSLIVSQEARNQGVGKKLIETAERLAKENGAHKMTLQTGQNWDSVKFYSALGYEITSELPNHYFHIDFVEMTKFLG